MEEIEELIMKTEEVISDLKKKMRYLRQPGHYDQDMFMNYKNRLGALNKVWDTLNEIE